MRGRRKPAGEMMGNVGKLSAGPGICWTPPPHPAPTLQKKPPPPNPPTPPSVSSLPGNQSANQSAASQTIKSLHSVCKDTLWYLIFWVFCLFDFGGFVLKQVSVWKLRRTESLSCCFLIFYFLQLKFFYKQSSFCAVQLVLFTALSRNKMRDVDDVLRWRKELWFFFLLKNDSNRLINPLWAAIVVVSWALINDSMDCCSSSPEPRGDAFTVTTWRLSQ